MKMRRNNKMVTLNMKQKKEAYKVMEKEIDHILKTFDYSNYEVSIYYDEKKNTTIVPKPVFALSFINPMVQDWIINQINLHPNCTVRFE